MKTILSSFLIMIIILTTFSYAQTISGKFIRFSADSVIIKTETDILNLPTSKELVVIDNTGQKVSPASLFENANVTINYQDGVVKSIVIDNQYINYIEKNTINPEQQLIVRDNTYQYNQYRQPTKISYVGYLPVDYQAIKYENVNPYTASINYYNYVPVPNSYMYGASEAMANEINFYNNLLANNYYSPRYYYEVMSSVTGSEIPNYYYISKIQEKTPYYIQKQPTNNQSTVYYANNQNYINQQNIPNLQTNNNLIGKVIEINTNKLIISADKIYEVNIDSSSNIFVRQNGKYIPLNNTQDLRNLVNKEVFLTVTSNNNKLIANTIVINAQ